MNKTLLLLSVGICLAACEAEQQQAQVTEDPETAAVVASLVESKLRPSNQARIVAYSNGVPDKQALVAEADATVKALNASLNGALRGVMRARGPVGALAICNTAAPAVAHVVSSDQAAEVSRVSLKQRNPQTGTPNEWQKTVLTDFEKRQAAGEKPASLVYSDLVEQNGGYEFRYMQAAAANTVCLTCHGTAVSPAIQTRLKKLYPQDKALGYAAGDLSGAFVVVRNLSQ